LLVPLGRRVVGILVILAGIAIVLLATIRPNPFRDERTIYARFDSVQGLGSIDRNIRVGGANVGEVGDVERDGDDVIVPLELDPEIRVTEDARALLRPHTLFEGSAFVDLFPGSPDAAEISEGDLIPKRQTDVYVSLDEATRLFRTQNREDLKRIIYSTAEVVRDEAIVGLRRTLAGAPKLFEPLGPASRALQGPNGDELASAVSGLSDTVAALSTRERDLIPLAQRLNRTFSALDVDGGASLDRALAALPEPLEKLQRNGGLLTAVVDRLDRLAVGLEPAARELGPLLRESRPLLRRATPIVERSTPLIASLRAILARAAAAAPSLEQAIEILDPGVRRLAESVLPVLAGDGQLGIPVYAQLAASFSGVTAALRPYQTEAQSGSASLATGVGHVFRLGFYTDPAALQTAPPCSLLALIDPEVGAQLQSLGLCRP
jgi:phospholipid/cholesterol/gamma-HCH transport system substrate-binding protein